MANSCLHPLIPFRFVKIFGLRTSRLKREIVTQCQILERSKLFGGYFGLPKNLFDVLVLNKTPYTMCPTHVSIPTKIFYSLLFFRSKEEITGPWQPRTDLGRKGFPFCQTTFVEATTVTQIGMDRNQH